MQKILLEFLFVDFLYNFKSHFIDEAENFNQAHINQHDSDRTLTHGQRKMSYKNLKFRANMQKFLMFLEPRIYLASEFI